MTKTDREIEKKRERKGLKIDKLNLANLVEGDSKAPFSIATTPMCRRERYSFHWIATLYP